jgi:hypothetical protein
VNASAPSPNENKIKIVRENWFPPAVILSGEKQQNHHQSTNIHFFKKLHGLSP